MKIQRKSFEVKGDKSWRVETPYGPCLLSALDSAGQVIFANRHHCTELTAEGASYAPPHQVNYQALVWALVVCSKCTAVVSLSSTGTLHPEEIPVGSMLSVEDYYMVTPKPVTFWGHQQVGAFEVPEKGVGRIHYSPAEPNARADWVAKIQGSRGF